MLAKAEIILIKINNTIINKHAAFIVIKQEKVHQYDLRSNSADPQNKCYWSGTAPACSGHCHSYEFIKESSQYGDGRFCWIGVKLHCCPKQAMERSRNASRKEWEVGSTKV